ncbi:MAG: lipid-binding SYLF domain-containing protein [Planctomycetia bacterium]|nr:lipid-binding SYLF domain-containing protein [Planctomycetia bacterium]
MKITNCAAAIALTITMLLAAPTALRAQGVAGVIPVQPMSIESAIVDNSAQVINEIMGIPGKGIPTALLADAQGLVIIPDMIKGGFVIGAKHGRGVVLVRDPTLGWQLPQFVTINGASVGWQAGIQAIDLVLVFRTKKSVQGLLSGKFTIGADAAAAAGPVGREASASTDGTFKAEIYSYSRSRGLFAGVSLDGSALRMDNDITGAYYQPRVAVAPGQPLPAPPSAVRLIEEINKYTKPGVGIASAPIGAQPAGAAATDPRTIQQNLAAASQRLGAIVDAQWKGYLALPPETYGVAQAPSIEALTQAVGRFQAVAGDPQYGALVARPEFAETLRLLQQLIVALPRPAMTLPPPPPQ